MSSPVGASEGPIGPAPAEDDHYRLAVEEARAQAESLRHAACRANDLVRQLEELVESLRAILLYPKAYDWPLVESGTETRPAARDEVVELDPGDQHPQLV